MRFTRIALLIALPFVAALTIFYLARASKPVERPEEIRSLRLVGYDQPTYVKLAGLWKEYYKEFPSEYSYANWMYASRYAQAKDYPELLKKGVKKYPSNPLLLYLSGIVSPGTHNDVRSREYLERAIAIDPNFVDPWFSLAVIYMDAGEEARVDSGLTRILQSGYITDDVMDYNYNTLIGLDSNAILITGGDNDTYPGWILTRILKVRPDVKIVNTSLLNSTWYPPYVIQQGVPSFITPVELDSLRKFIDRQWEERKKNSAVGPYADSLLVRLVNSAEAARRPVYFAMSLNPAGVVKRYISQGRLLGLAILVSPPTRSLGEDLKRAYGTWLASYRFGGLDGWRLRNAKPTDAGRMMMPNYAGSLSQNLDSLRTCAPELRAGLFEWYLKHIVAILPERYVEPFAKMWCQQDDVEEIRNWCRKKN